MKSFGKTDSRHTGSTHFKYYVNVSRAKTSQSIKWRQTFIYSETTADILTEFNEFRNWCSETWGMSCERTAYLTLLSADPSKVNPHWCWHTEFDNMKIYFRSEKEVEWAKLRWTL
jgi:hypothetical protein